jgi:arginine/lysine/ornithine decarboxylase
VCLYAALKKEADISDMTLTVIESRYPEKVVKHLTGARGYRVERMYAGIYEVVGDFVPIQFIVTPELSDEDNLFLKNLSRNVKVESLIEIFKAVRSRMEDGAVRSYLNAVVEANPKTMKEIGSMAVTQEFKDVMENLSFVKEMKQQWQAERSQMEAERLQIEAENAALRAQLAALTQQ